jgi:hypothetical protein
MYDYECNYEDGDKEKYTEKTIRLRSLFSNLIREDLLVDADIRHCGKKHRYSEYWHG